MFEQHSPWACWLTWTVKMGWSKKQTMFWNWWLTRVVVPNIITYNSLLDGYCLRRQMDEASKMMDMMHGPEGLPTKHCVFKHHGQRLLQDSLKSFTELASYSGRSCHPEDWSQMLLTFFLCHRWLFLTTYCISNIHLLDLRSKSLRCFSHIVSEIKSLNCWMILTW